MEEGTEISVTVLAVVRDCADMDSSVIIVCPDTKINALMIDSLKMIQIVFEIEVHFGIEIPEHALFQIDTLNDLINLVRLAVCSSDGRSERRQGLCVSSA
jgi:acyl carrier protein